MWDHNLHISHINLRQLKIIVFLLLVLTKTMNIYINNIRSTCHIMIISVILTLQPCCYKLCHNTFACFWRRPYKTDEVVNLVNIFKKGNSTIPLGTVASHPSSRPHKGVAENQGSFSLFLHLQLWRRPDKAGPNACAHILFPAIYGRWNRLRTAAGLKYIPLL